MNVLSPSQRIVHTHSHKSGAVLGLSVGEQHMRNFTLTITAVLAVLLLAVGGVTAHGTNSSNPGHDDAPQNGTAAEWATWMEQHMTEHMGADAATEMQDRMGMSYEEMSEHMASHQNGSMMNGMMNGRMMGGMMDGMMNGMMRGGMSGTGCH